MSQQPVQQLHMVWPEALLDRPPDPILPSGYTLRPYRSADAEAYLRLLHGAGFLHWNEEMLGQWLDRVLPDGLLLIEHAATAALAATSMAAHRPMPLHPFGGELGWVAGDPAHAGRGLGRAVCAGVVRRFLSAGYRRIYLKTDDWRLPAISIYLRLGFVPFLYAEDMALRWAAVCEQLGQPFTPDAWPKVEGA
jgi:mycothiol synthase